MASVNTLRKLVTVPFDVDANLVIKPVDDATYNQNYSVVMGHKPPIFLMLPPPDVEYVNSKINTNALRMTTTIKPHDLDNENNIKPVYR